MEKGDRRNFRDANWLILRCRAWRKWSKTCLAVIPSVPFFLLLAGAAAADGPLPYTRKSIARGKQFYLVNCVECHDQDGKGLNRRDFNSTVPADLTDPEAWLHGASAEAIFASIHDGTKQDMPPYKGKLQDEQIWHIVNFVRSLWPEAKRPKLAEE